MGRIELAEGNDKKTSCLSSIFSYFTGSSKSVEEEYTSEKNTYPPYSDIEPVYKVKRHQIYSFMQNLHKTF